MFFARIAMLLIEIMYFCPLFSGSSGNCSVVTAENNKHILIDAGLPLKTIVGALEAVHIAPDSISAVIVTHEHSDHMKSVGAFSRKFDVPIFANERTWEAMQALRIGDIAQKNIRTFETGRDFFIDSFQISPFAIPHDTVEPVGFSVFSGGKRICVATDIGHVTRAVESVLEGSDLLLIEANHDIDMVNTGSYPYQLKRRILGDKGHLSNESCGNLLVRLNKTGVKRAILGHLSKENNTEELAMRTVSQILSENDIVKGQFELSVAHRDRVLGIFEI